MEANVRKELDTLLVMVRAWKEDKVAIAGGDSGYDFLVNDFSEEIDEHIYPYARRMFDCEYLTGREVSDFLRQCFEEVDALRVHLAAIGGEE